MLQLHVLHLVLCNDRQHAPAAVRHADNHLISSCGTRQTHSTSEGTNSGAADSECKITSNMMVQ